MCKQAITALGLILDATGALILFFHAPPQPNFEESVGLALEDATPLGEGKTVADHKERVRRTRKRYTRVSRAAMLIIALGFVLQLWATWL